mgnify:CR=1 FL=1
MAMLAYDPAPKKFGIWVCFNGRTGEWVRPDGGGTAWRSEARVFDSIAAAKEEIKRLGWTDTASASPGQTTAYVAGIY